MFTTGKGGYVAEKAESNSGWIFPVGDEIHELGYTNMFTDMFDSIEKKRAPLESFYDGYIVNAVLDAAYASAKSKQWEKIIIDDWRGQTGTHENSHLTSYDDQHYLIKEETMPGGEKKFILKDKKTGVVSQVRVNPA
jgi:hypothetical protein